MARRSLKPQLNQIRAWVRQGRTDAWIAHQLEVSTSELREFRKQHGFTPDEEDAASGEVDLRDEIEAEIEAATAEEAEAEEAEEPEAARTRTRTRRQPRRRGSAETAPPPRPPWRTRAPQRARGKLRPRRDRRLRPLARPRGQGQSGVRRALGGEARGHGADRGRPDRDSARLGEPDVDDSTDDRSRPRLTFSVS